MAANECIDPQGYWVCPEGGIRRVGDEEGEQEVMVKKTDACSEAEWKLVCDALTSVKPTTASRTMPVERNCVIIS